MIIVKILTRIAVTAKYNVCKMLCARRISHFFCEFRILSKNHDTAFDVIKISLDEFSMCYDLSIIRRILDCLFTLVSTF
jgi:hypothetical protein